MFIESLFYCILMLSFLRNALIKRLAYILSLQRAYRLLARETWPLNIG